MRLFLATSVLSILQTGCVSGARTRGWTAEVIRFRAGQAAVAPGGTGSSRSACPAPGGRRTTTRSRIRWHPKHRRGLGMGSVPVLKPAEVCRLLERLGFNAVRQRGSHIQYRVVCTAENRPIPFGALGGALAVITDPDLALEPLREDEVLCARVLAAA